MNGAVGAALFIVGLAVWSIVALMQLEESQWFLEPGNPIRVVTWVGAIVIMVVTLFSSDDSLFAKFRTEAVSLAIAVIVLDELGRYRAYLEEKKRTIQQMASASKEFAANANSLVRQNLWHKDGSLEGRDLGSVWLPQDAKVRDANLRRAKLRDSKLRWSILNGASMNYAVLSGAILDNSEMLGTDLRNAEFQSASLANVKMNSETLLDGADFEGAIFHFAWLDRVKFGGSIICGADFSRAATLKGCDLSGALYDDYTKFPLYLDPKAKGAVKVKREEQSGKWIPDTST